MAVKPRSRRQEQTQAAQELRAQGWTWAQVAADFRDRYHVNARVALRLARGWSQREAADAWNDRWPDDPKTFKNFSAWELWPGPTGHSPALSTLDRLAQLYECAVSDVVGDLPNYGPEPSSTGARTPGLVAIGDHDALSGLFMPMAGGATQRVEDISFTELAQAMLMWVERANPGINRRELLQKISVALAVAAAAPLFDMADADERDRGTRVMRDTQRIDAATVALAERGVQQFRRQGDVLGPQVALQAAMAQRQVVGQFVASAPSNLRPQVLSLYAELSQLIGWGLFNLGDYRAAAYYYDDARTAAHDAENVELVTYVLCTMSQLATWQGKPRVGIDHAIAAQAWASQTDSYAARAYAADVAVRAFAADKREDKARAALDQEHAAVKAMQTAGTPLSSWWYFYDESFYWGTRSECSLTFGHSDDAVDAAATSLLLIDPANVHNYAHTLALQAEARIQQGDIQEAGDAVADLAKMTAVNRSTRVEQRIEGLRASLSPWHRTRPVRALNEALRAYGFASPSGSTNKS